jgi:hypothetical protein
MHNNTTQKYMDAKGFPIKVEVVDSSKLLTNSSISVSVLLNHKVSGEFPYRFDWSSDW